jgi:hypothetical protein
MAATISMKLHGWSWRGGGGLPPMPFPNKMRAKRFPGAAMNFAHVAPLKVGAG